MPHVSLVQSLLKPINLLRKRRKTKAERRAHKAFRFIAYRLIGCDQDDHLHRGLLRGAVVALLHRGDYLRILRDVRAVVALHHLLLHVLLQQVNSLRNLMPYCSAGNPFMYALANRQFKLAFLRMLHGDFRKL